MAGIAKGRVTVTSEGVRTREEAKPRGLSATAPIEDDVKNAEGTNVGNSRRSRWHSSRIACAILSFGGQIWAISGSPLGAS
jgi:hypothetical protein